MKSLLWKDYRITRLLLIFGSVVCVGPWVIAIARYYQLVWRGKDVWWGPEPWVSTASISLGLSLFTLTMLGGNAIAAERSDRSAEFLAYMPISRKSVLVSKSLMALTPAVAIWLVNLALLFWVSPRLAEGVSAGDMAQRSEVRELLAVYGAMSVLLLGSGWFWSSHLNSHGLATGMSISVLAAVLCAFMAIAFAFNLDANALLERWCLSVCAVVGIAGYLAGCAYYLRRLEP